MESALLPSYMDSFDSPPAVHIACVTFACLHADVPEYTGTENDSAKRLTGPCVARPFLCRACRLRFSPHSLYLTTPPTKATETPSGQHVTEIEVMMEPARNAEYGQQEYWDRRYTEEEHYDWFPSVYPMCVAAAFEAVEAVYSVQRGAGTFDGTLKVLHLGTGNSILCADIRATYEAKYPTEDSRPYRLVQIATDYSAVAIDRMKAKYGPAHPLEDVHWVVADVRDLSHVRAQFGPFFDVVLDKGTMDALQADKASQNMEDDIERMLCEVSRCVEGGVGTRVYRVFVQITWEVPYLRLYYTTKNAAHTFAWGTNVTYRFLGESDMYRVYTYEVSPPSSE